ncbi:MAG: hypothetical protein ACLP50_09885 [Solirubrobacteraceae bacterium]
MTPAVNLTRFTGALWWRAMIAAVVTAAAALAALTPAPATASLPHGSCVQGLVYCNGTDHSCPQVSIPVVDDGATVMEIDRFGGPLPSCGQTVRLLRSLPSHLREMTWGEVLGWRCRWGGARATCVRRRAIIWATNPGD